MPVKLTKVGTLAVRNSEAITGIRGKIAGTSRLVGFSDVDAARLAVTVSEIGRRLLLAEAGAAIGVYLNGDSAIEGLALSFPDHKAVTEILHRSNYFDQLSMIEENGSQLTLALKHLRQRGAAFDDQTRHQIKNLLSRRSRDELMDELRSKNEELEAHQVNLEREVAERTTELTTKEAQLRIALDNMPGGMFMVDKNLKFQVVNDQYKKLSGLPDEAIQVGGSLSKPIRIRAERGDYGPGDVDEIVAQRLKGYTGREALRIEETLPNGRMIEFHRTPAAEGGTVAVVTDITERKESERQLRKSEETFKAVVDQLPSAIALKDTEGRFTIANKTFTEWYSKDGEDIVGKTSHDLYTKDMADKLRANDLQVMKSGVIIQQETEGHSADGAARTTLLSKFPILGPDGKAVAVGTVETDITERKQAEEALRESEQQFKTVLDQIPAAIALKDHSGRYTLANRFFHEWYAGQGHEVVGLSTHDLYSKEEADELTDIDRRIIETDDTITQEITEHFADGSEHTLLMSKFPIRDSEGIIAVGSVETDITDRKRAEEELREARDAAEEATKAKATFLATMSHEIRTPMGGVIGMVDILQQTKLTDDQRQMINTVRDSAHSLLTIINDILDFSKIEAGKLDLEEIPISVREIVEGAGEALAVSARNKDIGLSVYVDPDIPDALVGDPVRLRQILFNFGSNAIKFTEQGKVLIRADKVPSKSKKAITVLFRVIDEGIGISKDAQKKLFQAFSQVDAATTRRYGGTGLGLSICQRLTEMMNGEVGVASVPGEGSTFSATITFPVAKEHAIKSDGHDLDGLNVLFAIGDDDMRELLPRYLEHWGATVTAIAEPGDVKSLALKAAETAKPFDVIGLGTAWQLAERIELVESLAEEKALSSTRFIIGCQGRVRAERKEIDNTVYLDTDPLRRGAFIKSVAVAAGRASPEVEYDESETTLDVGKAPTVAEAEAMGQLILLAEDNFTNQDVIGRQLTMLGYALEIANDGKEALELLETRSFAILLTDCHMPNMDGYELAEAIRKSEKDKDVRLPVIAVTASVMKEEIDQCMAAGMDDCLAKPLEMTKLKEMLRKWMPEVESSPAAEAVKEAPVQAPEEQPEAPGSDDGPIDPSALKSIFGDDEETFKEILNEFVGPATANAEEITAAVENRSAEAVGAAAHKLKSSSRSVGATELADLCEALEAAGKAGDWVIIDDSAPRLFKIVQDVTDYIKAL